MNHTLKLAILRSGRPQYTIARDANITETRLSRNILGRITPTDDEKKRIAELLGMCADDLFDPTEVAS